MGQTLSEPVTEKHTARGADDRFIFGFADMQGWRISMEDSHTTLLQLGDPSIKTSFFGVYDGHGGDRVAHFVGTNLHEILAKDPAFKTGDYAQALKSTFLNTDIAIRNDRHFDDDPSGCTATTALITHDNRIFAANAGDSRTVLGVKGRAKPLSFDHKPTNEAEKARICAAGGFVDFGRVNGNLALSRAIGDFEFKKNADLPAEKQIVTAMPDVSEHKIGPLDEFIVVACDGIWDCMSSQSVIEFVRRGIASKHDLEKVCGNIIDHCLAPSSDTAGVGCDNMTVIIIGLLQGKTPEEWQEMISSRVEKGDGPCAPPEYAEVRGSDSSKNTNFHSEPTSTSMMDDGGASPASNAKKSRTIILGDGSMVPDGSNPSAEKLRKITPEEVMQEVENNYNKLRSSSGS